MSPPFRFHTEHTGSKCTKGNNSKVQMQELWLLYSAYHLMLTDIYMKFYENVLDSLQVTEQTQFCDGQSIQISKGNNSKV